MGVRRATFGAFLLTVLLIGSIGAGRAQARDDSSAFIPPVASVSSLSVLHDFSARHLVTHRMASSPIRTAVAQTGNLPFGDDQRPTVGSPIEVNGTLGLFNAEVESAIDPVTHFVYDLWIANDGIGFARSTDRGRSFDPAFIIPGSEDFIDPSNPNVYASSWDPAIAVSSNGIVYAAFMDVNSTSNPAGSPFVAVSFDHGASFAFSQPVIIPSSDSFSDREFIAAAPDGTVYVTWNFAPRADLIQFLCTPGGSCSYSAGDFNLVITRSRDHGHTWSEPTPVSLNFPRGGSLEGPIVVGAHGQIFVAYDAFPTAEDYSLSPGQEWFTSSSDGGVHWTTPFLLSGSYRVALQVWWIENTLVRSNSGVLYTAFDVQTEQGDVGFVRSSRDDGVTWSPLIRVAPDVDNATHIMQVAAGDDGNAYIAWLTDNSTAGWAVYIASLSIRTGIVSAPVLVSPSYGDLNWWPGDTIGMAYLGRGRVSVSWGAQVSSNGDNDGIFNVIVRFDENTDQGNQQATQPL